MNVPYFRLLIHLPDQVAHEPGDVDGIGGGGAFGLEVLEKPVLGLVVDEDVVVADAGSPEAFCE